jgi:hypothetical protein
VRDVLLSFASPESLSWTGFAMLAIALAGEVGVFVTPAKWERLHRELAFGFAVLAAVGYMIERVGDDAMLEALNSRATTAESELKKISPRRLVGDAAEKARAALSVAPMRLPIGVVSRLLDSEGQDFADDIADVFNKVGWSTVRYRDWTRSEKGVLIATFEGTALPADIEKALADALDAANVPHKTITISTADEHTIAAAFRPHALYLLVGAHP